MEFSASEKQRGLIALVIEKGKQNDHLYFGQIWDSIQRTSDKVDDRRIVLAEKLKGLTASEASYVLNAYWFKKKGFHISKARQIIQKLNLI